MMRFFLAAVIAFGAVALIGGCAQAPDNRPLRYQKSVDGLQRGIVENDQPHFWGGILAYLDNIDHTELGAPEVALALLFEKAITVHWVGDELVVDGIELLDAEGEVLAYVDCSEYQQEMQAAAVDSIYFGSSIWFIYDDSVVDAEIGRKTAYVRLVLPDGSRSEAFALSKAVIAPKAEEE